MNKEVQQLVATGVVGKVIGNLVGVKRKFSKTSEPRILAIENLDFGFVIWMWFCGICVIVFLVELSFWSFSQMTKDWVFSKRIGNVNHKRQIAKSQKIKKLFKKSEKNIEVQVKAQNNIFNLIKDVSDLS